MPKTCYMASIVSLVYSRSQWYTVCIDLIMKLLPEIQASLSTVRGVGKVSAIFRSVLQRQWCWFGTRFWLLFPRWDFQLTALLGVKWSPTGHLPLPSWLRHSSFSLVGKLVGNPPQIQGGKEQSPFSPLLSSSWGSIHFHCSHVGCFLNFYQSEERSIWHSTQESYHGSPSVIIPKSTQ